MSIATDRSRSNLRFCASFSFTQNSARANAFHLMMAGDDAGHRTPGQLIGELLAARGWSRRVLSIVLKVDETVIAKIISGKRRLDAELALALGEVLDVPPERLLDLQKSYDLARARLVARSWLSLSLFG